MRYLFGFVGVLAALAALPLSASGQAGKEALPKLALAIHAQHRLPAQFMLRASYYLYLDADEKGPSRVERWHPEAFVDPLEPDAEAPDIDTLGQRAIEHHEIHYKTPNEEKKKPDRRRRRAIALGVTIPLLVVGTAVLIGGAIAASNAEF
ncbi:MAG: hypothetical protein HKP50_04200 [Myxococcales bacterium]|nr:hypothetical protein [Myxococcales bacterium]